VETKRAKIYSRIFKNFALIAFAVVFLHFLEQMIFESGISYLINRSMIWGLIPGNRSAIVLSVATLIVLGFFLFYNTKYRLWITLIMIGAGSVALERIVFGGALDYLRIWFLPAFNFADILIILGIAGIAIKETKNLPEK
jgi:lipoprotein signal peptidase